MAFYGMAGLREKVGANQSQKCPVSTRTGKQNGLCKRACLMTHDKMTQRISIMI